MAHHSKDRIIIKPGFWQRLSAWLLIVLGISGIILPILPGWPFFFLGIFILADDDSTREKIISWFPKKSQPIVKKYFDVIYKQKNKANTHRKEKADKKTITK